MSDINVNVNSLLYDTLNEEVKTNKYGQKLITEMKMRILHFFLFQDENLSNFILLVGPPGVGKTMAVVTIAKQMKLKFYFMTATDFFGTYFGQSEEKTTEMFDKIPPFSIIFIDEIDSLMGTRDKDGQNNETRRSVKNILLQFCDGTQKRGFIIIGATNLPWELDSAFLSRAGRQYFFNLPDKDELETLILEVLGSKDHNITREQISELASTLKSVSPRDVKHMVCEAFFDGPFLRGINPQNHYEIVMVNGQQKFLPCQCDDKNGKIRKPYYKQIQFDPITYVELLSKTKKIHRTEDTGNEYAKKLAEYKARYDTCVVDIPDSKESENDLNWDGIYKICMLILLFVAIGILITVVSLLTGKF